MCLVFRLKISKQQHTHTHKQLQAATATAVSRIRTKTTTTRQEKFHMSCTAYLSHIIAYVAKLQWNAWNWKRKRTTITTPTGKIAWIGVSVCVCVCVFCIHFLVTHTRYLFKCTATLTVSTMFSGHREKKRTHLNDVLTWLAMPRHAMQNKGISKMLPIYTLHMRYNLLCLW